MLTIDGNHLTIKQVINAARHREKVDLSPESRKRVENSRFWVEEIVAGGTPVYGINTGFGIFSEQNISPDDVKKLNRNLILSHAVATGPELPQEVVRAAMLIRVNTLAKGYSGVRPVIIETLLDMLNNNVIPRIPSQGSLGSSGDLAPLSHLALVFTTDKADRDDHSGWARFNGQRMTGKAAMNAAGIPRLILEAKEGLAITNGATFSAAIATIAVHDGTILLNISNLSTAMSLEALLGVSTAFDNRLHKARNHAGQISVAEQIRVMTKGSTLLNSDGRVHDAYSLRCAPQVQGAAKDAIGFIRMLISREINAATDNPLLFEPGIAISGGNFHGEPIGMVMDFLSIAMTEVSGISERRIFRLTDGKLNAGLPPMLVDSHSSAGLNSGMMMPQYTAASLVLENQTLASPDSVYSLPTSAEQEDHNANAMTAARHARQIVENTTHVLSIEIYCATRALDLRMRQLPAAKMGLTVSHAYNIIRKEIPYRAGDEWWGPEIERVHHFIVSDEFITRVFKNIDELDL